MDPYPRILQFIESWLKKGFEDPELTCSSKIREFARSVTGSQTMEDKAREIASLVDDPDHVSQRGRDLLRLLIRVFFYRSATAILKVVHPYDANPLHAPRGSHRLTWQMLSP